MFGLSISHMILLAALALIVIGPKQLPEVARALARFINELKRMTSDVSKTIVDARHTTNESLRNHPSSQPGSTHSPVSEDEAAKKIDSPKND